MREVAPTLAGYVAAVVLGGGAVLCCGAWASVVVTGNSEDRPNEFGRSALEEIVVTARRRQERLLDVPISLTVLPSAALEFRQIDDVSALQHAVPNMTVTPWPGSPARATISMRGQVEPDRFPTVDPAVGVYLDGVYIARIGGANLDLVDMQRVEVLRGPQGTLYGRNTIGGAINLIPRRPDTTPGAELTLGVGNFDRRDVEAIANVPFADDRYAFRVAASHTEHEGYGRNTLLQVGLNADDTEFLRAQLRAMPTDEWDLNVSFDYTHSDADLGLVTLLAAYPPLTHVPAASGNATDRLENYVDPTARQIQANRAGRTNGEFWGASAVLTYDLPRFAVKALSAYRRLDSSDGMKDLDGTPYDLFAILGREERQDQWSHEVQAYGDAFGNRLSWIGGLHFFEESATFFEHFQGVVSTTLTSSQVRPAGTVRNESFAGYAQLGYALAPRLHAIGGVRYNSDGRQLTSSNTRALDGTPTCALAPALRDEPEICRATLPERAFRYVPWMLGIDFKPVPDALVYAKLSRGHRAGGYNFRAVTGTAADTFAPERVTTWELGTRAEFLARRLRLAISLYRSLFDDMQVRTAVPLSQGLLSVPLTQNAGEARIEGGELEIEALLGTLRLAGALGITRGKYTEIDPTALDVTLDSLFVHTSDATVSIAADLPVRTAFGGIDLHLDYAWRDDEPFAYAEDSLAYQKAFGLLNAVIRARFDAHNLELQLWGRNLTNERYIDRSVDFGSLLNAVPGDPRTFGASLSYRIGARRAME